MGCLMVFIICVLKEICWFLLLVVIDISIIISGSWKMFCVMLDMVISDVLMVLNKKVSIEVLINGIVGELMVNVCSVLRVRLC